MNDLLDQIIAAVGHKLYFLALGMTLALPDMCAALSSVDGRTDGAKYAQWFDRYVANAYTGQLTGEQCYWFRCSLLHQGAADAKKAYRRVLFVEPNGSLYFHRNLLNDALNLDLPTFCKDVIDGVRAWLSEVADTEEFKRNYDRFLHRHPDGIPPYIVGVPVIG